MARRLALIVALMAVPVSVLAVPAVASAALPPAGDGTGPGYCTGYSGGSATSCSFDGVYACEGSTTGDTTFDAPGAGVYAWQCVELSARFLWAVDGIWAGPGSGVQDGADLVSVVHATHPQIPVGTPGSGSVPAAGDVISLGPGGGSDPVSGHTAVVISADPGTGQFEIMSENDPVGGAGEQSLQVDLSGGHDGHVLYHGTWTVASWLMLGPASPAGVLAAARDHSLRVSWSASGGSSYTATALPGAASCTTSGTSCVISGLSNDVTYSVSVTASASGQTSPPSITSGRPLAVNPDYTGSGYSDLAWLTGWIGRAVGGALIQERPGDVRDQRRHRLLGVRALGRPDGPHQVLGTERAHAVHPQRVGGVEPVERGGGVARVVVGLVVHDRAAEVRRGPHSETPDDQVRHPPRDRGGGRRVGFGEGEVRREVAAAGGDLGGRRAARPDAPHAGHRLPVVLLVGQPEMLTDEARVAITAAFGVPVTNQFLSTEGLVGPSDPGGRVHTFATGTCVVELLDAAGKPVQPGTAADQVLLTNLHNFTQPLIRYELADRFVRHQDDPGGRVRATVEGRTDSVFRYGDIAVHPVVFAGVLDGMPGLQGYRVRQTRHGKMLTFVPAGVPG